MMEAIAFILPGLILWILLCVFLLILEIIERIEKWRNTKHENKNKDRKTDRGYLYVKAENQYIKGTVGCDIPLKFSDRLRILFSKGISVVFIGK